jgi:hypothetical protein
MKALKYVFAPYAVLADWGDVQWHYAWTRREAMEWMACYPTTQVAVVKIRPFSSHVTRDDVIAARF